ncbi:hypothetical protein KUL25_04700 [Rhodobacteraceae bacterium N5(2021)]|uniref:Uncharacterized protein n=1 Tax=Gymnodinialimonas phycosphaerae TaxID=2841589 RepID=A0A975YGY5_9RHOB|nr:hypothetical protein [Gymnodinialimonas phycosphaerae]MBY4892059.1 hypothetical protein [Gymnodinialimonas phycosphaerae]
MALELRYSDIYHDLQEADYYTVPKDQFPHIPYAKLSAPALHNIYLMRRFEVPKSPRPSTRI